MLEGITLGGVLQGGATGLLGVLVLLIFLGKLRPASAFTELREDAATRVQEVRDTATSWREAYEISEQARRDQETSLAEMLEVVRTTQAVVNDLRTAGPPESEEVERENSTEPVSP